MTIALPVPHRLMSTSAGLAQVGSTSHAGGVTPNGASNGALNESIAAGSDLIRKAQYGLDGTAPNRYANALFSLGDALCDMFDQLRV